MAIEQRIESERIAAERERYVARGVATTPLVVARAEGARVWDVDGREYIDFAGGLGCQNTGHGFATAAIHEQVDRCLHQCFMVGIYEPYVDVCRLLDETWPGDSETKSLLVNSGAEAVENAVKIARVATGRPSVIAFDHAFHGRTNLTMALTSKVVPYKRGFGPFAPEVYRAPAPYPHRHRVGDRALRRRAGPDRLGQVPRRRAAARRRHGPRGAHGRRTPGRPRRAGWREPRWMRRGNRRPRGGAKR